MTQENFIYWLNGYVELVGTAPTPEQWEVIKEHLSLVMDKRTKKFIPGMTVDTGPFPTPPTPPYLRTIREGQFDTAIC